MNFVIKSLAPIVAGGGLGTGGVYAYRSVIPTTWQEYLEREGFRIIGAVPEESTDKDKDFKATFVDNENIRKRISELASETDVSAAHSKVESWCKNELAKNTDYNASTKENLIQLCTYSGIHTVKGKISQKDKTNWIKDNEDDKYKTLFAIYKYSEKFLTWLNEVRETSDQLKQTDKANDKYTDLKKKCEFESARKHSKTKGNKDIYNHVYWWCMALTYDTVENRIKAVDSSWQKETDKAKIEKNWKHTESVTNTIKTDQGKSDQTLSDSDYESWCSTQLGKKLYDEGIYRDKYLQIKSVCRQRTESTQ